MSFIGIGVDVGQLHDPTAIVVAQRVTRNDSREGPFGFVIRHVERLPLGTSYPSVSNRVADVVRHLVEQTKRATIHLLIDSTGVGRPVVDQVLTNVGYIHRPDSHGLITYACTFTAGYEPHLDGYEYKIPKQWLVSRLQTLLQNQRLHLPDTRESRALAAELADFEIRVSDSGHDSYGAFKTGKHDDLVTALGLACLEDWRSPVGMDFIYVPGY